MQTTLKIYFQVLSSLENKKRGVLDFISKGEKLMSDPNCPTFLEGHVQKLKEAWEDTNEKAQARKTGLMGIYFSIYNLYFYFSIYLSFLWILIYYNNINFATDINR